jgi:lipid II:glycine glycyltransferase (peptidoglycan interpeptide bridge formation enzyme)
MSSAELTDHWDRYLDYFPSGKKDIYFCEGYHRLYEDGGTKGICYVYSEGDRIFLLPFLRRRIEDLYDLESAYGYGGPLSNCEDPEWNLKAAGDMMSLLKEEGYLCGFLRFHPLMDNHSLLEGFGEILFDRHTVVMNTGLSPDQVWNQEISGKNRNMIRRAEREGLEFEAEDDFASLKEFEELYLATMRRLGADSFYLFDESYFENMRSLLLGKGFLATVRMEGRLICAAIQMVSGSFGHYHLQGSDPTCRQPGAGNYLLWKSALEMWNRGVKIFHLGGGVDSSTENSLFKFKKSFSSDLRDFYIGKLIFQPEKYREIVSGWAEQNPDKAVSLGKLLLCYRY